MKTFIAVAVLWTVALGAWAVETPLLPAEVNQILGQIRPDMSEANVAKIVKAHYPDAKGGMDVWSGQTGYVRFELTPRYAISIAEYNAPNNIESRFVHPDLTLYVFDLQEKRRTNITFYSYGDETKKDEEKPPSALPAGAAPKPAPKE